MARPIEKGPRRRALQRAGSAPQPGVFPRPAGGLKSAQGIPIKKTAASLDKYYIPTRYPNGLPGGIPAEAFIKEDSEHALKTVKSTIETVEKKIRRGV